MLQWHHFLKGAGSGVQQLQQHQTSNKEVITQFEQDDSAIDSVLEDEGLQYHRAQASENNYQSLKYKQSMFQAKDTITHLCTHYSCYS